MAGDLKPKINSIECAGQKGNISVIQFIKFE